MAGYSRRELLRLAAAAGAGAALGGPLARVAFGATTASYDDGSDAIPPGLVGDPERVIIVGAGWAGLTLANALRNAGVDHVLLEGRDRIGGRAHTVDLAGVPVDLGCSWIHQPYNGNPMGRYSDQCGVRRDNADVELDSPIMRFFDAYLDREVDPIAHGFAYGHGFNFAANESATISDELGRGASVYQGAQVYLDKWGLQGDGRRQAEFMIRMLSEFPQGYDWTKLSLYDWSWGKQEETGYVGVGEGEFPQGGYRRLVRAMAGSGEVRLRHRVYGIEQDRRGVTVRAVAGRRRVKLRGSHVVVAVPLGVLKQGSIGFAPRLPAPMRAAVSKVGYGAVEKVAMVFDEPFWEDHTHTHMVFLSDHAPLEFPFWVDLNRISHVPALVAFCGGGFAHQLGRLEADQKLELTLTRMQEILGRDVPRPRAFAATRWLSDPFACGSYSTTLVGGSADDRDALAQPVGGRVLFAGEATSRTRQSRADGAMTTGIREAKRLLRRPAVTLSAG